MYKEEGKLFYCLGFENNIVEISGLLYLFIFFACLKNYSQGLLFFFFFLSSRFLLLDVISLPMQASQGLLLTCLPSTGPCQLPLVVRPVASPSRDLYLQTLFVLAAALI